MSTPNNIENARQSFIYDLTGIDDPTVIPIQASIGTTYKLLVDPPRFFQKQDEGITTNWKDITQNYKLESVGDGASVVKSVNQTTRTAYFRTIKAGANISISQTLDEIVINSTSGSGLVLHKQQIVLSPTDISNQYVDLSVKAVTNSCTIGLGERVMLWEGLDYSLSVVGLISRISFIGPSAFAGSTPLEANQTLYIQCSVN